MTLSQRLNASYTSAPQRTLPPYGVQGGKVYKWGRYHAGPSDGYSPPPGDQSTDSKGRHIGLDVVADPPNGAVYALAPGTIRQVIKHRSSEGDQLIIEYWRADLPGNLEQNPVVSNFPVIGDDHVFMLVDHLTNTRVTRGQSISRGQQIANVSITDPTAGKIPHVHYGAWWSLDALDANDFGKSVDPAYAMKLLGANAPAEGAGKDSGNVGPASVVSGLADQGLSQIGSAITTGLLNVANMIWGYLVMRPLDFLAGFSWELARVLYDDADLAASGTPRQAFPGSKNHPLHLGPFTVNFLPNFLAPLQQDRLWILLWIGTTYYAVFKTDDGGESYVDRLGNIAQGGVDKANNVRQQRVRRQPAKVAVPATVTRNIGVPSGKKAAAI